MRFIAIFAAMKLNPSIIMNFSCITSLIGSIGLFFFADQDLLILQICCGIIGFGMASIYATGAM